MKKLMSIALIAFASNMAWSQETEAEYLAANQRQTEHLMESLEVDRATAEKIESLMEEFKMQKKAIMEERRELKKKMAGNTAELSESEIEKMHRQRIQEQRTLLDMEEVYYNKFLEILPASKVEKLLREQREGSRKRAQAKRNAYPEKPQREPMD